MRDAPQVSPTSVVLPEGGTVRPMTRWGTPVMHRPQQPVTSYDEELRALVADMTATMYAAEGVGLAACQIGVDRAVFVFDCPDDDGVVTGASSATRRSSCPRAATASSTTARRAACRSPAPSSSAPAPTSRGCAAPASTASR